MNQDWLGSIPEGPIEAPASDAPSSAIRTGFRASTTTWARFPRPTSTRTAPRGNGRVRPSRCHEAAIGQRCRGALSVLRKHDSFAFCADPRREGDSRWRLRPDVAGFRRRLDGHAIHPRKGQRPQSIAMSRPVGRLRAHVGSLSRQKPTLPLMKWRQATAISVPADTVGRVGQDDKRARLRLGSGSCSASRGGTASDVWLSR